MSVSFLLFVSGRRWDESQKFGKTHLRAVQDHPAQGSGAGDLHQSAP
jgi:hypothetical protein